MRLIRMAFVSILSWTVVLAGCSIATTENPLVLTEAIQLNLHIEPKSVPSLNNPRKDKQNNTARIPNPKLPKDLQRIQLFFKGVVTVYPDPLDEPIPNLKKRGAIVGLITQIAKAFAPDQKITKPDPQKNLHASFHATNQQLQDLKNPQMWKKIESDITKKILHLKKAQDYSINKDFDGYLQPMIDQLHLASNKKNYHAYAIASINIIKLNHIILAAVKKENLSDQEDSS